MTNSLPRFWSDPERRYLLADALNSFGPQVLLVAAGLSIGLLLAAALSVAYALPCLFDSGLRESESTITCALLPGGSFADWTAALTILSILGWAYMILYRIGIRHRWYLRVGPIAANVANLFALALGPVLLWSIVTFVHDREVARFEVVYIAVSGPLFARYGWEIRNLWMRIGLWLFPAQAISGAMALLLRDRFDSRSGRIDVRESQGKLIVEGPFDAVDVGRINDIADTHFGVIPQACEVRSTLEDAEYWRPYREDLDRSGYVSPPIRESRSTALPIAGLAPY